MLENTRRYEIERVLWDATADDLPQVAPKLAKFANEVAAKIATVYVHEALSAGSLDSSSTIIPAAMDRVALGTYEAHEFDGPMQRCLQAQLVVFSGLKIDKLDDLQAMIARGTIRWVFTAGSLAMALKKAAAELDGKSFSLGVAEDPAHADKPYFIPRERIEQAQDDRRRPPQRHSIRAAGRFHFARRPRRRKRSAPAISSSTSARKPANSSLKKWANSSPRPKSTGEKPVAFHNGVFGMFEDPRFESGTKQFISQLKRMKDAGVEVYVGGGEGGAALEKYGQPDWVTHCFTAGGTVLNALGSNPVPYLLALSLAAKRDPHRQRSAK